MSRDITVIPFRQPEAARAPRAATPPSAGERCCHHRRRRPRCQKSARGGARHTIREMHAAFRQGGREAIDKVMRTQPAAFLKLLVLLVPREMKVEHSGGVKAMTDEQLEAGIEAIQTMLAAREAGDQALVIEGVAEPAGPPAPARKTKR